MDLSAYQPPQALDALTHPQHLVEWVEQMQAKKRRRRQIGLWFSRLGIALWITAFLVLVVPISPHIWYRLFPSLPDMLARRLAMTADIHKSQFAEIVYQPPVYQPPFDPTLPVENRILITKIGVDTKIGEGNDWEEVLKDGVWRVPEFGTPESRSRSIILAAHRFGYLRWSNEYRRKNSFFNLPKLENGDRIEIIWNQRRYTFEIYEGYTGTEITDYNADLILYTCEVLNSDRRIIRSARLVQT